MLKNDFRIAYLSYTGSEYVKKLKNSDRDNKIMATINIFSNSLSIDAHTAVNSLVITSDLTWVFNNYTKTKHGWVTSCGNGFYLIDYKPNSHYSRVMFKVILKCLQKISE